MAYYLPDWKAEPVRSDNADCMFCSGACVCRQKPKLARPKIGKAKAVGSPPPQTQPVTEPRVAEEPAPPAPRKRPDFSKIRSLKPIAPPRAATPQPSMQSAEPSERAGIRTVTSARRSAEAADDAEFARAISVLQDAGFEVERLS